MILRRTLGALGAVGLLAVAGVAAPAHGADLGLRSVQASIQNLTAGTLTIQGAEVMSGQWVSGEQPAQGSAVLEYATTQVGALSTTAGQGPAASLALTGEGAPITIAMANPWAGAAAVHAVSSSSILASTTAVSTGSPAQAEFTVSLTSSSSRSLPNKAMRGSMRLTFDNRTDAPLAIADLKESSILSWRGSQPAEGDELETSASWRFANSDGRGDAGVIVTLTALGDSRVIVAASMRADGSRSADVIHSEGVDARVVHSPSSGWRVIVTDA